MVRTTVDIPTLADGAEMWRLAASCGLDPNSPYKYLLFCRDFAATSAIARIEGETAGFVTAYWRPATDTLFVWQIGVSRCFRRRGVAQAMLETLLRRRPAPSFLEATVTPTNLGSRRLFAGLAAKAKAPCEEVPLFGSELFPEPHEPEILYRIGPFAPSEEWSTTTTEGSA